MPDSRFCWINQLLLPFLLLMLDITSLVTRHLELHYGKNSTSRNILFLKKLFWKSKCIGIEYLVVLKKEVYTLRQLRELYAHKKRVGVDSIWSIKITKLIRKWLEGKVWCCMPKLAKNNQSGYAISADANILPDAINAIITG